MADITKDDVVEFIAGMTVLDLSELVKELEEKFGVSAAAPVAIAAGAPVAGEAVEEEQTEFDVILEAPGDKKIAVIKEVRALTAGPVVYCRRHELQVMGLEEPIQNTLDNKSRSFSVDFQP